MAFPQASLFGPILVEEDFVRLLSKGETLPLMRVTYDQLIGPLQKIEGVQIRAAYEEERSLSEIGLMLDEKALQLVPVVVGRHCLSINP